MKRLTYKLRLKGLPFPDGTISLRMLETVADIFIEASERTLRLAIEGRSTKRGKVPEYIESSSEFLLKELRPGSTELVMDAPVLAETAFYEIRQLDFWDKKPKHDDTSLTLLALAVEDASKGRLDSDHYDTGVLEALLKSKSLFNEGLKSLEVYSPDRPIESIILLPENIHTLQEIRRHTPDTQTVVLTGALDLIEHSTRSFKLRLPDGTTILGRIDETLLTEEDLRNYWGKEVTVKGELYFRSSGTPRFIEATFIRQFEQQDVLLSGLPQTKSIQETVAESRKRYQDATIFSELWGEWPGDENIQDLLRLLKKE
jgi:hypothetical protein